MAVRVVTVVFTTVFVSALVPGALFFFFCIYVPQHMVRWIGQVL